MNAARFSIARSFLLLLGALTLVPFALAQGGAISRKSSEGPGPLPAPDLRADAPLDSVLFLRAFERGLSALERGDLPAAQTTFALLAKQPAQQRWMRVGLATCALLRRDYSGATSLFGALTHSDDAPSVAFAGYGAALLNQGKTEEALLNLEIAARKSDTANPRFMLACALCLAHQPERAAAECERATQSRQNGPAGSLPDEVRGLAAFLNGEHRKAIDYFRRALAQPLSAGMTTLPLSAAAISTEPPVPIARSESGGQGAIARAEDTSTDAGAISRKDSSVTRRLERENGGLTVAIRRNHSVDDDLSVRPAAARCLRGNAPILVTAPADEGALIVVFQVDGKQRAIIGKVPFLWEWDTTREADGPHRLTVQILGADNKPLHTEERSVEIRNFNERPHPEPATATLPIEDRAHAIRRQASHDPEATPFERAYNPRIERLLEFQSDVLRVRYLLSQAYEAEGLTDFAAEEQALIFLEKPDYLDTRKRLLALRAKLRPTYRAAALPELRSVLRADKVVALTFDDGPRPEYTPRVLEILRQHSLRATFFLVGKMVDTYPQLARDLVAEGHEVANHSFLHENMSRFSLIECEQDVLRCERAVRNATGITVNMFRPPGGQAGPELRQALGNLGYSTILWTANITSFPDKAPEEIADRMAERVQSGGVILLHNGQDQSVFVLPRLLELLKRRSFRLVTVSQLLERPTS